MAFCDGASLVDDWSTLKFNPLFRRRAIPRGLRFIVRSPIIRAFVLTFLAVVALDAALEYAGSILWVFALGVLFWTMVHSFQHFFCWMELRALTATGNFEDYLASGMTREDVVMGLIYPAVMADRLAVLILMGYFLYGAISDSAPLVVIVVFGIVVVLVLRSLFHQPRVFLPDAENYLRQRNPLALYFIAMAEFIPLLVWFVVYWILLFGSLYGMAAMGMGPSGEMALVVAFSGAFLTIRWFSTRYDVWRLTRFYARYGSFDDLVERYLDQGFVEGSRR